MVWARARRGYIACQALIFGSWVSLNELIRSSDAGAAKSDTTLTADLRSARRARKPRRAPFGLKPGKCTPHRAPVGQGPSGPDWLAISFGFWSGRALATGTAWAGLCLIHHHHRAPVGQQGLLPPPAAGQGLWVLVFAGAFIPSTCDSLMAGRFSFGFWTCFWCWWALANLARCGRVCV